LRNPRTAVWLATVAEVATYIQTQRKTRTIQN
jgi:hypothetical protein